MVEIFQDRRKSPRLYSRIPIQYKDVKQYYTVFKGTLAKNIGENGLRVISNEFIPISTNLILDIFLHSIGQIRAICRVVWIEKIRYIEQYDIGMEFIEITDENRGYITDYIENLY